MELTEEVVIVGAGIAELATALGLKKLGIRASVLEKADALRTTGAALSLFPNAWTALDALGVSHKLKSIYSPLPGSSVTNIATGATREAVFAKDSGPTPLHRKALLEALAEELPADTIRFSSKITSIEGGFYAPLVRLDDGTEIKSKVIIGCDGVHSIVGKWLGLSEPFHSGRSAVRGLAVYPEGHSMKQQAHQFIGDRIRAGFAPLNQNQVYFFLVCHEEKEMPSDPEIIQKDIIEKYASNFPLEYLDVVRHSDLSSLSWAPLVLRSPLNVIFGNLSKGTITVAGDAMHPTTPDLGQGGCLALEDAVILCRHIGNSYIRNNGRLVPEDIGRALDGYVKERRWRAALIITGSFLSGWVQQDSSNWVMKFFRDFIFYGFLFTQLNKTLHYDCGKLPSASPQMHSFDKRD